MLETKQLSRKFTTPGSYTIKLTVVDDLGNSSYDTEQFYVSSTAPVPSFTITSSSDLKAPSEFILDASSSFDEDMLNGNDSLQYNWSFTPNEDVTLTSKAEGDKEILLTFDKPGDYTIKLLVEDAYGEIAEIEKDLEVVSTLRPRIYIDPVVAHRGTDITFNAETNKPVSFYEWNLGDGKVQKSNTASISHAYTKAGVYKVSLRAVSGNGEENTVQQQIFMGQKDMPVVGYAIKGQGNTLLQKNEFCETLS
jgi:PKD repeat protein